MNSYNNPCQRAQGRYDQDMGRMPYATGKSCMQESGMSDRSCKMEKANWPIGMTYVPIQKWGNLYEVDEGFHQGTIFKELNLPFTGRGLC